MKKENRKMAQQRRAEERRKKAMRKKISKILAFGIPALAVLIFIIVLVADGMNGKDGSSQSSDTTAESTSDNTDGTALNDTAESTSPSYSTDSSLAVADGDTVNIDYVGSVDGVEFSGGNTQGMGTDLLIGSGSYIDDFEEQLIGSHPGDTVDVYVTFPDPYGNNEELSGKEALFTVTINGIYP